jgi:hypothetical protein
MRDAALTPVLLDVLEARSAWRDHSIERRRSGKSVA